MVVRLRLGQAEAIGDDIEERHRSRRTDRVAVVVGDMKPGVIEARLEPLVERGISQHARFRDDARRDQPGDASLETANSSTRMPLATTPRETSTTWMEIPGIGARARLLIRDEGDCVLPWGR